MGCGETCGTLGGTPFDPISVADNIHDRGSTNATGRHGSSNRWNKWPKRGSPAGITARAPYNIGNPKTPKTLAGTTLHHTGLDLGPHGHGIGVVKAAIGGPHNKRTEVASVSGQLAKKGGKVITPQTICFKCAGTWIAAGVIVVLVMIFTGR